MSARAADIAPPLASDLAGLEPMETLKRRWPTVIGALITAAMIFGLARQLFGAGLAGLSRTVPASPLFYAAFILMYLTPQSFDFVIFRRLWRIPAAGFVALVKKRIANDVVLGYTGEAYFYAWARQNARMVAAPFGAVKDVSILSAIAGNAITLTMITLVLPLVRDLLTPPQLRMLAGSAGVIFVTSVPFLVFSKRVFSLARGKLWWIFMIHCLRIVTGSILVAFAWHFAMPSVSIGMWLFLSVGRLLVSRLPLVPNKDLLFANFAILFIGQDEALSGLVAFTSASTLLVHVVLIASFGLYGGLRKKA